MNKNILYIGLGTIIGMVVTEILCFLAHVFIYCHFSREIAPVIFFIAFSIYSILILLLILATYYKWNKIS